MQGDCAPFGAGWGRGCWAACDVLFGCGDARKTGQECLKAPGKDQSWVLELLANGKWDGNAVAQEKTNVSIYPVLAIVQQYA